jgi:hypothetical protein
VLVVVGLFLPHLSAFALSAFRGRGDPRFEAVGQLLASVVVGVPVGLVAAQVVSLTLNQVGCVVVAGSALLLAPLLGSLRDPALRPRLAPVTQWPSLVRESVPYVTLTVLSMLVWTSEVWVTRWGSRVAELGVLRAAVIVTHGGLFGATVFGALLIHRVKSGAPAARRLAVVLGPALAALAMVGAFFSAPAVCSVVGVSEAQLRPVLGVALLTAPVSYVATLWLPIGIALSARRARAVLLVALPVVTVVGFFLRDLGARGGLWALALGQLVVVLGLGRLLFERPPDRASS